MRRVFILFISSFEIVNNKFIFVPVLLGVVY